MLGILVSAGKLLTLRRRDADHVAPRPPLWHAWFDRDARCRPHQHAVGAVTGEARIHVNPDRLRIKLVEVLVHEIDREAVNLDEVGGCIDRQEVTAPVLQAGDAVSLRAYTRPYGTPGSGRTLVLRAASGMVIPATS